MHTIRPILLVSLIAVFACLAGCQPQSTPAPEPMTAPPPPPPKLETIRPLDDPGDTPASKPAPPPPTLSQAASKPAPPPRPANAVRYVVKPGDTYWRIAAAELGDPKKWPKIEALNPRVDRNSLMIGQVIFIPATDGK
jgi:nucleoid-associated protein YgaU